MPPSDQQIRFAQPNRFSFKPEDWPKWISRFSRYRRANRLDLDEDTRQVDALLFSMGPDSEELLASLSLSEQEA